MTREPSLTALCAGYELGIWRTRQLVEDVMGRHLASFALSFTEFDRIDGTTAAHSLKKAAQAVYETDKYHRRGEFGELLLHAAARDFFGAQPAVSKIHFKDSDNDTVKGFDCVHLVECDGEVELWLGEVKFYTSLSAAIRDSTTELEAHVQSNFLRREFIAITNKLDPNWPHTDKVKHMLDDSRSLDEIRSHLVIPVMLTYDSATVSMHTSLSANYVTALEGEAEGAWSNFRDKLQVHFPVTLHLILVPLESKAKLTDCFHEKLRTWQHI